MIKTLLKDYKETVKGEKMFEEMGCEHSRSYKYQVEYPGTDFHSPS